MRLATTAAVIAKRRPFIVMAGLVPAIYEFVAPSSICRHIYAMDCAWV